MQAKFAHQKFHAVPVPQYRYNTADVTQAIVRHSNQISRVCSLDLDHEFFEEAGVHFNTMNILLKVFTEDSIEVQNLTELI